MKRKSLLTILFTLLEVQFLYSQNFVTVKNEAGAFPVVTSTEATSIYIDENDDWLVQKAASLLQNDIRMVTGREPKIISTLSASGRNVIILGSIAKSALVSKLVKDKKLDIDDIKGRWETFKLQVINNPIQEIESAFVIVGSDKRGTAYGVFELSEQIGVSPWYWWADVPVKNKNEIFIKKGAYKFGPPTVKYRGIFINDEAPAFSGWTKEKFGGVNHLVYEKIFELLLRLKANYLWPAMWANAFNDDDTLNPILANKYGIVMGTSHHEPMLRAQQEWKRYGKGPWNYDSNEVVLNNFWRKGIENMDGHESIVTIGMRGDGDKPMTQGTAIDLLERIVSNQRKIIEEVTGKPASEIPQDWALYKEVQDYYDKAMRVPDDVTLLLCDDNWGNIRRLPKLTDPPRSGGYGIYYHFDYVGGPRNYKWINTNNIARVWEQMHLAYEYNVRQIWIVNVGDLKPMEFPISFFLNYAWNVNEWNDNNLQEYYTEWAAKQFGPVYATEIGSIIRKYSQFNARRKPELLDANTYEIYNESRRVIDDYNNLLERAERIGNVLPGEYKNAFFELVLHPIEAYSNLLKLYAAVAWNQLLAKDRQGEANEFADSAKKYYTNDSLISLEYNRLNNGKWDHMMDQTHIGYTYWQQPPNNKIPDVTYVPTDSIKGPEYDTAKAIPQANYPKNRQGNIFYEFDGYVSIEAAHYSNKTNNSFVRWKLIPDVGRDGDGITTFPVTAVEQSVSGKSPHLEYEFYSYDSGSVKLQCYFSPTLNFHNDPDGLQYGISIDNETPQIISINKDDNNQKTWEQWVSNNVIIKTTTHSTNHSGKHIIKFWRVSPAVVLQKIVVDSGGVKPSYLGPSETIVKYVRPTKLMMKNE